MAGRRSTRRMSGTCAGCGRTRRSRASGKIRVTVGRIPWRFGDDSAGATVRPVASAAGELQVHTGSCKGPLLATLPLARAAATKFQTTLAANVSTKEAGNRTLCIVATGDPRHGQWAIANVSLSK